MEDNGNDGVDWGGDDDSNGEEHREQKKDDEQISSDENDEPAREQNHRASSKKQNEKAKHGLEGCAEEDCEQQNSWTYDTAPAPVTAAVTDGTISQSDRSHLQRHTPENCDGYVPLSALCMPSAESQEVIVLQDESSDDDQPPPQIDPAASSAWDCSPEILKVAASLSSERSGIEARDTSGQKREDGITISLWNRGSLSGETYGDSPYKIYKAGSQGERGETPRLVVWLHGADFDDISVSQLLRMHDNIGCRQTYFLVPLSPKPISKSLRFLWGVSYTKEQNRNNLGFVFGELHKPYLDDLCVLIRKVSKAVQAASVWCLGYSMGGFGAYQLAAHDPDAFNAVAVAAGYVLGTQEPSNLGYGAPQPASRNIFRQFLEQYAARLAIIPSLVVVHSELDKVSSFLDAKTVVERVRAVGGNAQLVQVPQDVSDSKSGSKGRKSGHQYCNYAFFDACSRSVVYSLLLAGRKKVPMAKKKPRLAPPDDSAVAVTATNGQASTSIDAMHASSTIEVANIVGAKGLAPKNSADSNVSVGCQERISSPEDSDDEMADSSARPGVEENQASPHESPRASKTQASPMVIAQEETLAPPSDSTVMRRPTGDQPPETNNCGSSVAMENVAASKKDTETHVRDSHSAQAGVASSEALSCQIIQPQDAAVEPIGHDHTPKKTETQTEVMSDGVIEEVQASPTLAAPALSEKISSHKANICDVKSQASSKPAPKVKRRPQKPRPATATAMDTNSTEISATTAKTASSDSGFGGVQGVEHSSGSLSQPSVSGYATLHQDHASSREQQDPKTVDLEDAPAVPSKTKPPASSPPAPEPSLPAPRWGWRNRKRRTETESLGSEKKKKSNFSSMTAPSTSGSSNSTCPVEPSSSSNAPSTGPGSTAKAVAERLRRKHGRDHDDDDDVEEVYVGHVKSYTPNRGIGFLNCAETFSKFRSDLWFHRNQLKDESLELAKGTLVQFTVGFDRNGRPEAHNMQKCVLSTFKGVVKRFLHEQGFGFIGCEDEGFKSKNPELGDVFFHKSHVEGEKLKAGDLVTFAMDPSSASRPKVLSVAKFCEVSPTPESKEQDPLAGGPEPAATTLQAPTQGNHQQPSASPNASCIAHGSGADDKQTRSQSNVFDNEGRSCDLGRVVVNFISVGSRYGEHVLKREGSKFDWEGVRRCVQHLTQKYGLSVIGVVYENFRAVDEWGSWSWDVPADIQQMCESIELTPRLTGRHQRNAHDEMTIKCAYRRNCRFLDNNNYKAWLALMKDEEIRTWLRHCQEFLQLRFFFDGGVGAFDLLDGNIPTRWCTAPLAAQTRVPEWTEHVSEQSSAWPTSEHTAEGVMSGQPAEDEVDDCNEDAAAIGSEDACEDIVIQSSNIAELTADATACDVAENQLDEHDDCEGANSAMAPDCGDEALTDAYMIGEECQEEEPPVTDPDVQENAAETPSLTPLAAAFMCAFDELPE